MRQVVWRTESGCWALAQPSSDLLSLDFGEDAAYDDEVTTGGGSLSPSPEAGLRLAPPPWKLPSAASMSSWQVSVPPCHLMQCLLQTSTTADQQRCVAVLETCVQFILEPHLIITCPDLHSSRRI